METFCARISHMKNKRNWETGIIVLITILDAIYQISPVDLISDLIPIVGQLDDTCVMIANVIAAVALAGHKMKRKFEED